MSDSQTSAPEVAREEFLSDLLDQIIARRRAGITVDLQKLVGDRHELREELERMLPTLEAMAFGFSDSGNDRGLESAIAQSNREIGDFRIVREIGRGGMGIVYEAQQLSLGRRVALKILPFAAVLDERQLARFKNEAMAAALLEHPHIVPVYSVGCERGVHFYAMRYIEGTTLAEAFRDRHGDVEGSPTSVLDRGRPSASAFEPKGLAHSAHGVAGGSGMDADRSLPPAESQRRPPPLSPAEDDTVPVAQISTQAAPANPKWWRRLAECGIQAGDALEDAHQHGVIHRDVKPGNLLIDARGHLWVTDFGLAQVAGNHELTMSGDLLGTLRYMSPEQAAGQTLLDARTDVYSLGATLYELLTGRPVVSGADRQQLLQCIAEAEPKPPRQLVRSFPGDLETIILKCLAKDRDERYPSAGALAADLRRLLDHQPIEAKRPGVWRRAYKWSRRHRPLIGVGLAGFVAAALIGGWLLWRERNATAIAWEQERRQRVDAQANLDLALSALENIYAKFLSGHMGVRPDLRDLQVQLVRDSVVFYTRIALANRTNPLNMPKAARAFFIVAQLNQEFGDQQVAEEAYEHCCAIWRQLVNLHPKNLDHVRELAKVSTHYGRWLKARGRQAESIVLLREAIALFTRIRTQFRVPFDHASAEEDAWCNYALALADSGQLDAAEQAYETINAVMLAYLEQWPQAFDTRVHLAAHLRSLGEWRGRRSDLPTAVRYLEQAAEQGERAIKDSPRTADVRVELTWIYRDLNKALRLQGKVAEADATLAKYRRLARELKTDFPGVPEYRQLWQQLEPVIQDKTTKQTTAGSANLVESVEEGE